jgi:hypothetical protein
MFSATASSSTCGAKHTVFEVALKEIFARIHVQGAWCP